MDLIYVRGAEINQMLTYMIDNAVKAFENLDQEFKEIHIETKAKDGFIYYTMEDNGVGIREDDIKHVFDPFFTTRNVGDGQGLGLTICYDTFVNQYNGDISIESQWGKGTKIEFKLPITNEEDFNVK